MSAEHVENRPPLHTPAVGQRVAGLAGRQHGVLSRRQLRELGLESHGIARRVARGTLHPLYDGRVYSVSLAPLSTRGTYLAAVMASGPRAALSHRSAADLWGLRPNSTRVEVSVPQTTSRVAGLQIHRTRMLEPCDFTVEAGIPVTSVARTLLDLSAVVKAQDLLTAIDRAERLRIFDLTAVVDVLDRAKGRLGARALGRVIAAYEPSSQKSELERRFKQLLETAADIPTPTFNALVDGETGTHEVDAYWGAERLAVQLDGFEFHRTRRDRERDATSDADLEVAGLRVMRLTWDDATKRGERTLRRIRLAFEPERLADAQALLRYH